MRRSVSPHTNADLDRSANNLDRSGISELNSSSIQDIHSLNRSAYKERVNEHSRLLQHYKENNVPTFNNVLSKTLNGLSN